MNELTIDEVEQVSGGLTYYYTFKGVIFIDTGAPIMEPSPGPVIPDMS